MATYNKKSVDEAIKRDPRIKPKEAKLIHALLKDNRKLPKQVDYGWTFLDQRVLERSGLQIMAEQKDKHPWVPKTMLLFCMAVALGFIIVGANL